MEPSEARRGRIAPTPAAGKAPHRIRRLRSDSTVSLSRAAEMDVGQTGF